ncbi:MAG TPA: transglycosylase SLT domain-containing protein [Candidatus Binatia bacterium]|nr:transglycosylase SLT domain-containing protein [Candidatus Binatia bacterium]
MVSVWVLGLILWTAPSGAQVQENPLPLLPGLENSVEFWKRVFTVYGANDVIFHDRQNPLKIYQVVTIPDGPAGRKTIKDEIERLTEAEPGSDVRAQRGVKERFASGLALSRRYIDQMKAIFREEGLPEDIAYLPLVESSFDLNARSTVGALGMWQFMPSTGKYFMRIGPTLDERRDPIESTRAAARFMKQNYNALGSWPLAITAYNHGRDGVLRAVGEVGSDNLVDLIQRYQAPSWGFASKNFYTEFLAAVELARRGDEYFPGLQYHEPLTLEELPIERNVSIASLLKPSGISHAEFLEWNPALTTKTRDIPAGYRVKAPSGKLLSLSSAYQRLAGSAAAVVAASKSSLEWILHHVAPGETLYKIARNYRVTVDAIQQANGLNGNRIAPGQQLKIPKKT